MKKFTIWSLYVILLAGLIFGAINRTSAKLGEETSPNQANSPADEQTTQNWISVTGTVDQVFTNGITIQLEENGFAELSQRGWAFAQQNGFIPQTGDSLILTGFYENGVFEIAQINDLTNHQQISLRDADGHPLWRGNK